MPDADSWWMVVVLSLGLGVVHLYAGRLRFLEGIPRSRWLSFASGVSVAYVFVHLLPELSSGQAHLSEHVAEGGVLAGVLDWIAEGRHVWVLALAGLAGFYGLERVALRSGRGAERGSGDESSGASWEDTAPAESTGGGEGGEEHRGSNLKTSGRGGASRWIFWLHMASYGTYNALVGVLMTHQAEEGAQSLLIFWVAMGLHFLVNDYGLRRHHRERYHRPGRWILAGAVLVGVAVGYAVEVGEVATTVVMAVLGGSVILNVLKEELPEDRQSRFLPFAAGAAGYSALLFAI